MNHEHRRSSEADIDCSHDWPVFTDKNLDHFRNQKSTGQDIGGGGLAVRMADASDRGPARRLRVDLDIEPSREWDCPIVNGGSDLADVRINAVGDACSVDLKPADGGGVRRDTGTVGDDCLCHVFQRFDCVPHVRRVEDGTMVVTTYVDERSMIRELVGELEAIFETVRLIRLAVVSGPDATEQVTFDLSSLTPKQRGSLELAVLRGYFDDDGDVSLGDLADELEISKPALSQRLRTAQAKIIKDVFDEIPA